MRGGGGAASDGLAARVRLGGGPRARVLCAMLVPSGRSAFGVFHFRPTSVSTVAIPDVVGMTAEQAKAALAQAGLGTRFRLRVSPFNLYWNRVLSQEPAAGRAGGAGPGRDLAGRAGQEGTLPADYHEPPTAPGDPREEVAPSPPIKPTPPPPAYHFAGVPSVVGMRSSAAAGRVAQVGLRLQAAEWRPGSRPIGIVLRQSPRPGADAPNDDLVRGGAQLARGRRAC